MLTVYTVQTVNGWTYDHHDQNHAIHTFTCIYSVCDILTHSLSDWCVCVCVCACVCVGGYALFNTLLN